MVMVREVVRDVVSEVAPQELPLVDGLLRYDDATVTRRLRRSRARREPLGFGWTEVIGVLTPVVWLVLDQVAQRAADAAVDGTAKGSKNLLRKLRRRRAPVTLPPLTEQQRDEIRREIRALSAKRGLDEDSASRLADEVVRRLGQPTEEPREPDTGTKPDEPGVSS